MSENPSCPREREREYACGGNIRGDAYIHGGEESVCEREREREREREESLTQKKYWYTGIICVYVNVFFFVRCAFFSLFVGVASRARAYINTHTGCIARGQTSIARRVWRRAHGRLLPRHEEARKRWR